MLEGLKVRVLLSPTKTRWSAAKTETTDVKRAAAAREKRMIVVDFGEKIRKQAKD